MLVNACHYHADSRLTPDMIQL